MGLSFTTKFTCDKCGKEGMSWNCAFSKATVMETAREKGWKIGKDGWTCPDCQKKQREE